MTTCNQCKEKFHKDCVNVAEKNFNCTSCSFKNKGLTWSEKPLSVYNTCPIDNTFTHLAMRCEKSPQFKEEIHRLEQNGSTDCVKAFAKSIIAAENNDSGNAQEIWANAIGRQKSETMGVINMFDGPDIVMYKPIEEELSAWKYNDLSPCDKCGTQKKNIGTNEVRMGLTTQPVEHFKNEMNIFQNTMKPCDEGHCKGKRMVSAIQFKDPKNKPLYLKCVNEGSLQGPEYFLDLPKTISMGSDKYQLGSIVMYDKDRKHFTSLQHFNDDFIYYDGLLRAAAKGDGKRHRLPIKTDYIGPNIVVDHVLYVRCFGNEKC